MSDINYPEWTKQPKYHSNNKLGRIYLRTLKLDPDVWNADAVSFILRNSDVKYQILGDLSSDSIIVNYFDEKFTLGYGGCIIDLDGLKYHRLADYPTSPENKSHFDLYPPNRSSTPIETNVLTLDLNNKGSSSNYSSSEESSLSEGSSSGEESTLTNRDFFELGEVYCFDLDKTLTLTHLTGKSKCVYSTHDLYYQLDHPKNLTQIFTELIRLNKTIYIVTFSDSLGSSEECYCGIELVSKIIQMIVPQKWKLIRIISYFPYIYGLPINKNSHLDIVQKETEVSKDQILLIDDNFNNIDCASSIGYKTLHTPNGITNKIKLN